MSSSSSTSTNIRPRSGNGRSTGKGARAASPIAAALALILALALAACTGQPPTTPGAGLSPTPPPAPTAAPAPTEAPAPTAAPAPTEAPTAVPAPTTAPAGEGDPLPAPLLFVDDQGRLAQLGRDGTTITILASPADPVYGVDVAPDGTLVFWTAGDTGAELLRLAPGQDAPSPIRSGALSDAQLSRDGATVALRLDDGPAGPGVYTLPLAGGDPQLLQADRPPPGTGTPEPAADLSFRPLAWSPDGSRLLMGTFIPEADFCGLAVKDLASGALALLAPQGALTSCSEATWSTDGTSILLTVNDAGATAARLPGLFQADPATGAVAPAVSAKQDGQDLLLLAPHPVAGGGVRAFAALVQGYDPAAYPPPTYAFAMVESLAGEGTAPAPLRADTLPLFDALWAPDGSGAAAYVRTDETGMTTELIWLPADGGPALTLPVRNVGAAAWGR